MHCECRWDVAARRFSARVRHPGHLDAERSEFPVMREFKKLAELGPLGMGALVPVSTCADLAVAELLTRIESCWSGA